MTSCPPGGALMKFLLEFASYCGCGPSRSPVPATSSSSSSHYGRKRRSLVQRRPAPRPPPSRRPHHVVKRRRLLGASSHWRPTLVPISEDVDVDEVAARLKRQGKRLSHAYKALHDYDSRRASSSRILTAFYPMPCMF